MTRKQRHRPATGIECVYEDKQFSAISLCDPAYPNSVLIQVYSKPHNDLVFEAFNLGLLFYCKRCKERHIVRWDDFHPMQKSMPPYQVLCVQAPGETWLASSDQPLPDHLKAYRLYTITDDMTGLLTAITGFITNNSSVAS